MNLLHATWFWALVIAGPIATVVAILARLSRLEPPPMLPRQAGDSVADGADEALSPSPLSLEKDQK
ncbi:MAG: hypothetical protein JO171_03140 [Paludibacterium sp.]|uniref:hypothetical protein n=1 Tax=Paludibacterium sp. TaxID=1917523 RepID=UPI0025D724B1|nr:hypothetical protein [Paludibacterium sp.]MBV8046119.1 hypothetical protein [Paludibacterium sp.]MBV8648482.1 hypothetical protein [Paludibacterium sp.]